MNTMKLMGVVSVAFAAITMGGCTPIATWPPVSGKPILAPEAPPCPQLMSTAVTSTRQNTDAQAPLVFNLPPATPWKVWADVQQRLGADARMMAPGEAPVFDVRQIRLDGGGAQVDVVYRTSSGVWQMATVHFTGAFGGNYRPNYFQRWVIPVDPPVSNTPAPPPPPPPPGPPWPTESSRGSSSTGAAPPVAESAASGDAAPAPSGG